MLAYTARPRCSTRRRGMLRLGLGSPPAFIPAADTPRSTESLLACQALTCVHRLPPPRDGAVRWLHPAGPSPSYCGTIVFNGPGDLASNILALGVGCAAAEALVNASSESSGAPYEASAEGNVFHCTATDTAVAYHPTDGMTYFVYHCAAAGGMAVWFRRIGD